jgi:transposase
MTSYLKIATAQEKAMYLLWYLEKKKFFLRRQRRYITQYGNGTISDNAIRRWLKQFQETGSVLHRKRAGSKITSLDLVERIQEAFLEAHKNQLDELLCS